MRIGTTVFSAREMIHHQYRLISALYHYLSRWRRSSINNAKKSIESLHEVSVPEKEKTYALFCSDYDKYRAKFDEWYYSYLFPEISKEKKREYLTQRDMGVLTEIKYNLLFPDQWQIMKKKEVFLEKYAKYVHRKWIYVYSNTDHETVQAFLNCFDVIVKPTNKMSGQGVYKLLKGDSAEKVFLGELPVLVEECVYNVPELAEFHPASLNTVRVTTVTNGVDVRVLGACLRTGNNNSVFDNADAGGYFAEIDEKTGHVISDGISEKGVVVTSHPASGKVFNGMVIPMWNEIISACISASLHLRGTYLVAWDIAVTPKGIEFIEGNSMPSMEVHQMPQHTGVKKKLYGILDDLHMPYKDAVVLTIIISRILHIKSSIRKVLRPKIDFWCHHRART